MLSYSKTIKIWLIEYAIGLFLHILYAFNFKSAETARIVLFVSVAAIVIDALFAFAVKNENVVISVLFVTLFISVTVIGYVLNTLGLAVFVYLIAALMTMAFAKPKAILWYGVCSITLLVGYIFAFPGVLLSFYSLMSLYVAILIIYVASIVDLYIITYFICKNLRDIKAKTEEAELASESKMRFLSNMSHEIRTPMNAIYGMAELSLRDDTVTPAIKENLENIQKASRVLISIVNDILDYSKMETGSIEIIPVNYSIRKLCNDVVNMMHIRMEDKDVQIRFEIESELPDVLIGDEIRIRQILFNLLSNAIKNTEKGYIILRVKGETINNFLNLQISIIDSGIGIRKEDIPKLFSSFQQIDSRRSVNREGTGLGLAIVKELLKMMGGDIEVESTYGVGSKFTFYLSQQISKDSAMIQFSDDSGRGNIVNRIVAPEAKVLVVDDNQVNLKVAKGLLRTFEINVDTCKSGRECLEILKDNKSYDIIFIDHMMPELDGIDTLNLIRSDSSEYMQKVPLVVLTANVATGVREMFLSEGFDEYVAKPIDMVWLNSVLCKLLPRDKQR